MRGPDKEREGEGRGERGSDRARESEENGVTITRFLENVENEGKTDERVSRCGIAEREEEKQDG